jgi:hypothetical protein
MCEKVPANEDPAAIAAARRKMTSSPERSGPGYRSAMIAR